MHVTHYSRLVSRELHHGDRTHEFVQLIRSEWRFLYGRRKTCGEHLRAGMLIDSQRDHGRTDERGSRRLLKNRWNDYAPSDVALYL
jgi:hypothetical protein